MHANFSWRTGSCALHGVPAFSRNSVFRSFRFCASVVFAFGCCCFALQAQTDQVPNQTPKASEQDEKPVPAAQRDPSDGVPKQADVAQAKRDAADEAENDPDEIKQPGTPLGRFLGRLFLGPDDGGMQPGNKKRGLRNDPRAPFDTKLSALLKKAGTHFRAKETRQCADVLQRLLELPEDALWEEAPGKLISVRTAAQRMLAKLPAAEQDRYRLQVGGQAQRELQQAQETGSPAGLAQVATKYFQTEAGHKAADQLAAKYLDRGEFGLAAHWLEELWQAQAACTKLPGWRIKAEFVAKKAPMTGLAKLLKSKSDSLPAKAMIAGQMIDSLEWLASQTGGQVAMTPTLDDWPQFFGSAKRVGQAAAGEPLLLKRWAIPLTGHPDVQTMVDTLIDELRDQRQVPILTFDPLLVDGKVIFRALRGVKVADAETGKLLWTTPDEPSVDDLLSAVSSSRNKVNYDADPFFGGQANWANFTELFNEMQDIPASDNPLTHLLFRNANHGLLSSDGSRVFVIEEQSILTNLQPGRYLGEDLPEVDALGRPLGVNRLTAYDLRSGRSAWEIGGRDLNDPFALPLAGTFIFGPPVVEGGDLFLVNESEGEIRLQVLDPASGTPRWSQLIAHAQAKIGMDFGRQWFTSQVAVADGVIVCPTTVGWLVAVDRTTRNILWAHRYENYRDDEPAEPHEEAVQPAQLNERWTPAPPVIVGNRVIFTPPESQTIVCLSLSDGQLLWQKPREEESLYLAGVFGKQAVLVGAKSMRSIDIENKGRSLWTVKYGAKEARPAGRGVAVQERYYLPLTTGELLCINLSTTNQRERIAARLQLPPTSTPELRQFGNLAMYRGMLLSLGSQGMVAFEPKLSIEDDLRRQLAANPKSAAAVIRKAELELLQSKFDVALDLLHQLRGSKLEGELQQRYRSASVSALSALVRTDLKAHDAEFEELAQWAELPAEHQARDMLKSERFVARQEFIGAFEVYFSFAQSFGSATVVPGGASGLQVRGDHWSGGKLEQLWKKLPSETATVLDQRVRDLSQAAVVSDIDAQYRFLTLFGFHPAAQPVRRRLVEALAQTEAWQAAENVLLDLELDPANRHIALERLARLWRQAGLLSDAAQAYQTLEREFSTALLDGGKSVGQTIQELRDAGQLPSPDLKPLVNWRNRDLELNRSGSNYDIGGGIRAFSFQGAGLPFFRKHRIQYLHHESRFEVIDVTTEKRFWSVPLRISEETPVEAVSARVRGHEVVLFGGGYVTSLSPMERRVVWSRPQMGRPVSDEEQTVSNYYDFQDRGRRFAEPLQKLAERSGGPGEFVTPWSIFSQHGEPQVIANQRYVSYLGRRHLVVLDAATGEVAWERQDLPTAALVRGGPRVIYVFDLMGETVTAYSALDGSKLEIPELNAVCKSALDLVDDDFIRIEPEAGRAKTLSTFGFGKAPVPQVRLQRFDPLTQSVVWRTSFSADTKAARLSGQRMIVMNGAGQLQLCHLKTGALSSCGALSPKELRHDTEIRVIPTYDQLFVVANQMRLFPKDSFPESFSSVQVHGMVHAIELETGKEQWKQKIEGLHLIVERLDYSPVVLFVSRVFQQKPTPSWTLSLKVIDRYAGKIVHSSSNLVQATFQVLMVNVPDEFIEFRTYNDRIRLSPKGD
jgi:outer membrane protein assembly factor BamB